MKYRHTSSAQPGHGVRHQLEMPKAQEDAEARPLDSLRGTGNSEVMGLAWTT